MMNDESLRRGRNGWRRDLDFALRIRPPFDPSLALWLKGGCRSAEEVRQFRVQRGRGLFDGQQVLGPVATQDKLAMPTWAV
jgi:hypothetical protein